ncbi:hypothetical protein, partial [Nostoc sp. CHAB 5715]|uniref:hypothetical protein n=1 Tax=Nostoc sp. CHAB 5715 TaxID=2780400 RepID=UPI001E2AE7E3
DSLILVNESLILANESLILANESLILANESLILANESLILANESLILANESLILANESLILANESLSGYAKFIYVIANEVKQSKALAIASFRFAPLAMTNVYLILHNYLILTDADQNFTPLLPCPMPHAPCPMPNAPCPIPNPLYSNTVQLRLKLCYKVNFFNEPPRRQGRREKEEMLN